MTRLLVLSIQRRLWRLVRKTYRVLLDGLFLSIDRHTYYSNQITNKISTVLPKTATTENSTNSGAQQGHSGAT